MMDEKDQKQLSDEPYKKAWEELNRRQLSNSETLDKSILSLSTAGLGFSLAFIKNVVPLDKTTVCVCLLYESWVAFVLAIAATLVSFHTSQKGIERQFAHIQHILLEGAEDPELKGRVELPFTITKWLGRISTVFYIAAIILTVLFIILIMKKC
ncbi:MAG: hypothetical protein F4215_09420 [Gemmatimonadetes bacterium]|nr:hypothetical protein [Gemmatimonadota bacterium]